MCSAGTPAARSTARPSVRSAQGRSLWPSTSGVAARRARARSREVAMGRSVGAQGDGVAVESPQGDHVPGDQPDRPRLPRRSATASSPCGHCGPTTSTRWSSWCGTRRRCGRRPRRSLTSATTPRRPARGLARAAGGVGRRRPGRRPAARPHQRLPARRPAEPDRWRDRLLGPPRRTRPRRRRRGPRPRGGTRVHARWPTAAWARHRLQIGTAWGNTASRHVAERAGFTLVGHFHADGIVGHRRARRRRVVRAAASGCAECGGHATFTGRTGGRELGAALVQRDRLRLEARAHDVDALRPSAARSPW